MTEALSRCSRSLLNFRGPNDTGSSSLKARRQTAPRRGACFDAKRSSTAELNWRPNEVAIINYLRYSLPKIVNSFLIDLTARIRSECFSQESVSLDLSVKDFHGIRRLMQSKSYKFSERARERERELSLLEVCSSNKLEISIWLQSSLDS